MNNTFNREQYVYLWRIFARSYSTYDRELLKNFWTVLLIENKEYVSNAKESLLAWTQDQILEAHVGFHTRSVVYGPLWKSPCWQLGKAPPGVKFMH